MEKRKTLEQPLTFRHPLGGFFNTLNFFGYIAKKHICQSFAFLSKNFRISSLPSSPLSVGGQMASSTRNADV